MKTIAVLSLVTACSAFAPAQQNVHRIVAVDATADLEGLLGTDIESAKTIVGNKNVSSDK